MLKKPKLLSSGLIVLAGTTILLFCSTYESNAVRNKSSVSCELVTANNDRGLIDSDIKQLNLSIKKEDDTTAKETEVKELKEVKDAQIANETKTDFYMWTTDKVNLRTDASINSDVIITLDSRTKVKVLGEISEQWIKVQYEDEIGYIYSKYLRDTESPKLDFTDEDIDLLAKIVWLESRGEPDKGSAAVVIVIINRILSSEYPDTLYDVVSESGQFSSWKLLNTATPTEREYEIIDEVLHGEWDGLLSRDYIYFSTSPRNNNGTVKIGNHYFCKQDN